VRYAVAGHQSPPKRVSLRLAVTVPARPQSPSAWRLWLVSAIVWCGAVAAELRGGPWRDEPDDYRCGAVIVVAGEFLACGGLVAFGVPPVT